MGDIFFAPINIGEAPGGALHSLATCNAPPHLQQTSFLTVSVPPRETWPYPWDLMHRGTSACSRMQQFTHPFLSLPSPRKFRACASVKRTTAVCTPSKYVHWSPRSDLPTAIKSTETTSSLVTVSSRSLTSRVLNETKDFTAAFSPTARSSPFSKVETSTPSLRTRSIYSLLVLRMERTSAPEFWGFTMAFMTFQETQSAVSERYPPCSRRGGIPASSGFPPRFLEGTCGCWKVRPRPQ